MKVESVTEHEDGSATAIMDLSTEEVRMLIEYAVIDLLKKLIADTGKNNQWTE